MVLGLYQKHFGEMYYFGISLKNEVLIMTHWQGLNKKKGIFFPFTPSGSGCNLDLLST
jgi:hypothetical protein